MKSTPHSAPTSGAMRLLFQAGLVLLLCFFMKPTAYSQNGDATITQTTTKYDSLLLLAKRGLATIKDYDTLQSYQKQKIAELNKLYDINANLYNIDSIAIIRIRDLERDSVKTHDTLVGLRLQQQVQPANKGDFGFGLFGGLRYNPNGVLHVGTASGIGIVWAPKFARFSLKPLFKKQSDAAAPAVAPSGDIYSRLRTSY